MTRKGEKRREKRKNDKWGRGSSIYRLVRNFYNPRLIRAEKLKINFLYAFNTEITFISNLRANQQAKNSVGE